MARNWAWRGDRLRRRGFLSTSQASRPSPCRCRRSFAAPTAWCIWRPRAVPRPAVFVEQLWAEVGTVRVYPLIFDLYANGIPLTADIERVAEYIEKVRPAGALVTVAAPVAVPVDITIARMSPNTTAEQAIIKT